MASNVLQEPSVGDVAGKFSATRVVFTIWAIGVFVVWFIISIKQMKMEIVPEPILYLLGILMTGKVGQRFAEKP